MYRQTDMQGVRKERERESTGEVVMMTSISFYLGNSRRVFVKEYLSEYNDSAFKVEDTIVSRQ